MSQFDLQSLLTKRSVEEHEIDAVHRDVDRGLEELQCLQQAQAQVSSSVQASAQSDIPNPESQVIEPKIDFQLAVVLRRGDSLLQNIAEAGEHLQQT